MNRLLKPLLALALSLAALCVDARPAVAQSGPKMRDRISLQLYSYREQFKADGVDPTLDMVQKLGFKYVELAGTYGLSPDQFLDKLKARGLVGVAAHFPYDRLKKEPEKVAQEAKALNLQFMGCAWAGHKPPFDEKQCREVAAVFNRAGAEAAKLGMKFYYHNHGFEFRPYQDGTLFDLLVKETDPKLVSFEMDVLWTVLPGQDPAKLLLKYPDRWKMVHLKDLKKGVPTGDHSAKTDKMNDVELGTGQVDWPAFFRAAEQIGILYYFIEDESPIVVEQLPKSVKFLKAVQY